MLHIQLFGSLCVHHTYPDGHRNMLVLTSRLANILAFLALFRGRYFSREELVEELWDNVDTPHVTQGAFNTTLWRLRKNIESKHYNTGELIERDGRGFICFRRDANVYLDIEEFKKKSQQGLDLPTEKLKAQDVEALNSAVVLYQADILSDFNAHWALREREKLRRIYFSVLTKLTFYSRMAGDFEASIRFANLILDSEPLREDVHREIMELYELSGQRALALRQFETCRSLLRQELAISPMPQTMQIYQSIANHALHSEQNFAAESAYSALEDFNVLGDNPVTHNKPDAQASSRALITQACEHMLIAENLLKKSMNLLDK